MKIANYRISLNSNSTHQTTETEQTDLNIWVNNTALQKQNPKTSAVILQLSEEGKKLSAENIANKKATAVEAEEIIPQDEKNKLALISDFVYILTGKRIKFVIPKLLVQKGASSQTPKQVSGNTPQTSQQKGWGIDFSYRKSYSEEAHISFSANGIINTSDGRKIQLELALQMSRSFYSETSFSFKAGDALIDPIVINLDNTAPWLSGERISFDINMDGKNEDISLPDSSSGFLALDQNQNGRIDNGSELFGPQSGNGFKELAQYDSDYNNWIDENDPVYDRLQIWQHDDNGNPSLIAIGRAGIGAIYLGSIQTDFKYTDNKNNTRGLLRQTGVYLRENGSAGTIHHIDL